MLQAEVRHACSSDFTSGECAGIVIAGALLVSSVAALFLYGARRKQTYDREIQNYQVCSALLQQTLPLAQSVHMQAGSLQLCSCTGAAVPGKYKDIAQLSLSSYLKAGVVCSPMPTILTSLHINPLVLSCAEDAGAK